MTCIARLYNYCVIRAWLNQGPAFGIASQRLGGKKMFNRKMFKRKHFGFAKMFAGRMFVTSALQPWRSINITPTH